MRTNQVKLLLTVVFIILTAAVIGFKTNGIGAVVSSADDPAAVYKAKCAMCHSPKAEKHFDLTKSDEQHVAVILNGKKDAKPPMPEYASKGITPEQAKELVAYMRGLRTPDGANTNAAVNAANSNTDANTNATVNANSNANVNTVVNANANTNANTAVPMIPNEETAAMYKAKCAMCHSPKAEKLYDPEMALEEQVNAILKGKKAAKPPHMPAFDGKVTAEQARALAEYMKSLRATK
jgi:mono/diheme cytochrome c family protein